MIDILLVLLKAVAVAGATAAVVVLAILVLSDVIEWFQARQQLCQADSDMIAFTLQDRLANGRFKTVQGVFNKKTSLVVEGRRIESERVDKKLAGLHRDGGLAIYQ
jgi:hypothetical protein